MRGLGRVGPEPAGQKPAAGEPVVAKTLKETQVATKILKETKLRSPPTKSEFKATRTSDHVAKRIAGWETKGKENLLPVEKQELQELKEIESLQQRKIALQGAFEQKAPIAEEERDLGIAQGRLEQAKEEYLAQATAEKTTEKEVPVVQGGSVEEQKRKLGLREPEVKLGGRVPVSEEQIKQHRKPSGIADKTYAETALTEKYAKAKLTELTNEFKTSHGGRAPDKREQSKLREAATQWAYDNYVKENIDKGLYNPAVIAAEMKSVLGVGDEIPPNIDSQESAMKAISKELDQFNIPEFAAGRKQSQVLTNELRRHLEKDVAKTMKLFKKVYPDKTWEEAFVFCRDMARASVYQVIFDKTSFTGSDHGVLHVHHNCENGDHMHQHMDEGDMSDKAKLLSRIMHFYHDIGYSVGASSFFVKKDHPFIGAQFIEDNREYFEHYLGAEETDILKNSILYHAIVSFDSKVGDDFAMVRFTTSNSDACAVSSDQKTQSFWREHPETLMSLAKLRQFLLAQPEYTGKLSSPDIIKHPEKVFPLKVAKEPPDLSEENFVNPMDFKAWTVFSTVRQELLEVAQRQEIPEDEKAAFMEAIETNFNAVSNEIVIGQFGIQLKDVSVERNPDPAGPKYLPSIEMSPSVLYAVIESCYTTEVAGKNIRKLCQDEYGAKQEDIEAALQRVGSEAADRAEVHSDVAKLTIAKQTERPKGKLLAVEATLRHMQAESVPLEIRLAVNKVVNIIKDMSAKKKTLSDFANSLEDLYTIIGGSEIEIGVQTVLSEFSREVAANPDLPKAKFDDYVQRIRTECSNAREWEMMGVESPLK